MNVYIKKQPLNNHNHYQQKINNYNCDYDDDRYEQKQIKIFDHPKKQQQNIYLMTNKQINNNNNHDRYVNDDEMNSDKLFHINNNNDNMNIDNIDDNCKHDDDNQRIMLKQLNHRKCKENIIIDNNHNDNNYQNKTLTMIIIMMIKMIWIKLRANNNNHHIDNDNNENNNVDNYLHRIELNNYLKMNYHHEQRHRHHHHHHHHNNHRQIKLKQQQQQHNYFNDNNQNNYYNYLSLKLYNFIVKKLIMISLLLLLSSSSIVNVSYVNARRSIRIMAPDYIFYRDPLWLNCSVIDLDFNQIYSIKWFKDNNEMYRFITADEQMPRTFYDTPGVVIDESRSNYGNLYILRADFKTEANFRCEVLAEDDFETAIQIKKIRVYYIPRDGQPIIVGKKSHFGPNEPVNLTCTSPMSTPAARLVVNLNGNSLIASNNENDDDINSNPNRIQHPNDNNQVKMRTYYRHFENGQSSTSVNVQFPGSWLQTKRINQFECTSSIIHRYNRSATLRVEMKIDPLTNQTLYVPVLEHNINSNHIQDRLEPRIENYKKKYEFGEQISLQCISSQYKPMPELYWLLNGQQLDAQYLDYKLSDYNQNGHIRVDLKYTLNGQINDNNVNNNKNSYNQNYLYHQHQRRQHGTVAAPTTSTMLMKNQNNKRQLINNNNKNNNNNHYYYHDLAILSQQQQQSLIPIDSYQFECIQVLSNVISVSSEVVQLYGTSSSSSLSSGNTNNNNYHHNNEHSEQSLLHDNSVEAVKSFIGNHSTSTMLLFQKQLLIFNVILSSIIMICSIT